VAARALSVSEPAREKLSLGTKLIYGAPSVAGAAMAIPVAIHVNPFYSDTVLVPLAWVALAAALARVLDAIIDPFVGWLSDHTQTRWGRRRPWIAIAAPIAAIVFVALFTPPTWLSTSGAAVWFGTMLMLFFILNMLYGLPHAALGPELTLDYHERSTLFSVREGFALVGTIVAVIVPGVMTSVLGVAQRPAYAIMALGYGALMVTLYWLLVLRVRERPDFVERKSNPLVPGIRRSLRNRPFLVLFVCYAVANIPGAIPGLLMPYFNRYVLNPPPIPHEVADGWLMVFLFGYFMSGLLFLPLWLALARRIGKLNAWLTSFIMGITGGVALFSLGPGDNYGCLVVIIWAGSSFGAGLFLPPAIQADVIDYDELHTGKRREAQYLALWGLVPKFIVIPSASLPLALLAWLGYQPNVAQSESVVLAIRSIFALTPAVFSIAAFFIAWRFPIDEIVHRAILAGVEAHRRGESVLDPLTGRTLAPPDERDVDEDTGWFLDYFSRGELKRVRRRGARGALGDVLRVAAIALALTIGLAFWVKSDLEATGGNPGPLAVFAIVIAGFAITLFVFHLSRIGPALRLRTEAISDATLDAHLANTDGERGSGVLTPVASATPRV
jgi:GPH family glycoside/pentoside/hexuronide:cation symporter